MTLILALIANESNWLLADRRLTYANGRAPKDDARKLIVLETKDGDAILGYAGLGATVRGNEPADWMSAVLRGVDAPLESCLKRLASASERQLPPHLSTFPHPIARRHQLLAPSFVEERTCLYTIDLEVVGGQPALGVRRLDKPSDRTSRICLAGSGAQFLLRDRSWVREILRLVRACDGKRVTPWAVADSLSQVNERVFRNNPQGSVGPGCIVAWRNRKGGNLGGGGGHQFYRNGARAQETGPIPTVSQGLDISALVDVASKHFLSQLLLQERGIAAGGFDEKALQEDLDKLPEEPDEDLR